MRNEISDVFSLLPFSSLDYLVIGLNLLIFLFAGWILKEYPIVSNNGKVPKSRMMGLRAINLTLFIIYAVAGVFKIVFGGPISHLQEISQTGLTILVAFIILHYMQSWIIVRFGKEKAIYGETYIRETYASEIIGLLALILICAFVFLTIINIWDLDSWLQTTSVIGGVLILIFAAKDYFLGDLISGLMMHYNESVEAGSVIRVKELGITGVVLQITLSQTIIRDLTQKHEITIPNSKLRNSTVETISNGRKKGFRDFLDFKIGYDQSAADVKTFLEKVWKNACEAESGINPDAQPKVVVIENGDHAVSWRLLYYVKIPYRLLDARNTVQTLAFEMSQEEKIGLNTPVTHQVLSGAAQEFQH